MGCILCGQPTDALYCFPQSVTSESKLIAAASELRLCTSCGHLQTAIDVDLDSYYAEQYDALLTDEGHDEIVSTTDGKIVFRTDLDFELMKRHVGDLLARSPSIFEYGCGRGRILSRLYKEGHRRLAAYDVSELYRDAVSALVAPDSLFIGQRPADTFDLVMSFFVLEHDVDPLDSLLYLRGRLGSDGVLYLMVPNYATNSADLACADHVNHFSPRMLSDLLRACGMPTLTIDDTSAIGAVVAIARAGGPVIPREHVPLADSQRVAFSRASGADFLDYMERLECLARQLRGHRVALYGAGFYGVLVQARLASEGTEVTAVFDANPRKQGMSRMGLVVRSPDELSTGQWSDADLVMCINPRIAPSVGEKFAPFVAHVDVV